MKFNVVILVILASVGFFNPFAILTEPAQKLLFYISMVLCMGVALFDGVSLRDVKYPRKAYFVLLGAIFFSSVMGAAFHMQSYKMSIIATLPYLMGYAFFYALMRLDVPRNKLMNAYLVLCGISSVIYFINAATFPDNMFGLPIIDEDITRGIIRLPVVFIEFFPMVVFYAVNKWLLDRKPGWIVVVVVGFIMIFLSVIRQIIALTAVLTLFFFFRKVSWKWKALMAAGAVSIVVFVLPMIPMYNTMIELSEQQKEENDDEENIRIQSWRFYTYENQTNAITPIFGNGVPSYGSRWGMEFSSEAYVSGRFAEDVGWAGFFWFFGAIATAALLIMLVAALRKKKAPENQYLNYWLIFVICTSVASGPPLYYWQILDIMVCLYLVFKKDDDAELTKQENDEQNSPDNTKLQQLPRYPQLH